MPRAIIYNSRVAARQYEALGYASDRTVVIPNGFDLSRFRSHPDVRLKLRTELAVGPDTLIVGLAARNHPMKDPATLVRAVKLALESGADLHLLITGAGMTRPSGDFAAVLSELPSRRVTLREHDPDMAGLLPGLDTLALSSAWGEGFPNILGEAMACGVPCIATDVGDSRLVVGESGIIVPPRDPAALAGALRRMAAMTAGQRQTIGQAARRRVEELFSLDQVAGAYHRLFESVVTRKSPEAPQPSPAQAVAAE